MTIKGLFQLKQSYDSISKARQVFFSSTELLCSCSCTLPLEEGNGVLAKQPDFILAVLRCSGENCWMTTVLLLSCTNLTSTSNYKCALWKSFSLQIDKSRYNSIDCSREGYECSIGDTDYIQDTQSITEFVLLK